VDITFKIINVLNLEYSMEARSVWTFVQINLYNIRTKSDKTNQSMIQIEKELLKMKSASEE